MLKILILVVLASGCAGSLKHINRMGLALSTVTTTCDWGQTRSAASSGWRDHHEGNPIMGSAPSTGAVDAYMASVVVGTIALSYILPERVRPFLYGTVIAVEANTIRGNLDTTQGMCGISNGVTR